MNGMRPSETSLSVPLLRLSWEPSRRKEHDLRGNVLVVEWSFEQSQRAVRWPRCNWRAVKLPGFGVY